jgi:hypothetical protein
VAFITSTNTRRRLLDLSNRSGRNSEAIFQTSILASFQLPKLSVIKSHRFTFSLQRFRILNYRYYIQKVEIWKHFFNAQYPVHFHSVHLNRDFHQ